MDSFVYKWTNKTLNKVYIGYHKGTVADGYICSSASAIFWNDFNNIEYSWEREILYRGSMKECQLVESEILDNLDITSDQIYNNKNNLMFNLTDEVRLKLSRAATLRGQDPEYRKKQAERTRNHWVANPDRRRRQSDAAKKQVMTEETKEKIRIARAKQIITPESRQKAAEKIRGTTYPKSHGEKISIARMSLPVVACPHCGKSGKQGGAMSRFHFDNCKRKDLGLE